MGQLVRSPSMGNLVVAMRTVRQSLLPALHPSLHANAQAIRRLTRVKRRRLDDDRGAFLSKLRRLDRPACTLTYERPAPTRKDVACRCRKSACCRRRTCTVRIGSNTMSCGEVRARLSPGQWLTSDIVNAYLYLVCAAAPVAAASSFMVTSLMSPGGDVGPRRLRWTRYVDWNLTKLLLVPIHLEARSHWLLAVAHVASHSIMELDPLPPREGTGPYPPPYLACLQAYLKDELALKTGDSRAWTIRAWPCKVPRQTNGDDCGVFVCEFARRLADRLPVGGVDPRRMSDVRRRICRELLSLTLDDR